MSPDDVAEYAPDAPEVTDLQVEEALDWAEPLLERAGIVLVANSRQEREARRAVCAYALSVATGINASTKRTSTAKAAAKRIKVGTIELEKPAIDVQTQAAGFVVSAGEYRTRAWRHLRAAGVIVPLAVGASR